MAPVDGSDRPPRDTRRHREGKVGRVIGQYGLSGLGDEIGRRWTGEGVERQSLRELANFFNERVLEAAIEQAGGRTIAGEIENLYRLLSDNDPSASARAQAEAKLSRMGVDVESLGADFVSHQAIHTYLTKIRDIESPTATDSPEDSVKKQRETIQRLRSRLRVVSEQSLTSLNNADHVALGIFDVIVNVTVHCNECDTSHDVIDILSQRGCDCQLSSE